MKGVFKMGLWTFAEASQKLDCTPQNIYQKKAKLVSIGGIEIDESGKEKINDTGFNYLQTLRKTTLNSKPTSDLKFKLNSQEKERENIDNTSNTDFKQVNYIINVLQGQIEDLKKSVEEEKKQKEYWQNKYTNQNEEIMTKIFPALLGTEEQNRKQEENAKKGFFGFLKNNSRH